MSPNLRTPKRTTVVEVRVQITQNDLSPDGKVSVPILSTRTEIVGYVAPQTDGGSGATFQHVRLEVEDLLRRLTGL